MIKKISLAVLTMTLLAGIVYAERVQWYSINENFQVVENGPVPFEQAKTIIDRYIENQKGLRGSAEYVISKSLFGFFIDEKTFIEIAIDDERNYRVKFECPDPKIWGRLYQKEVNINKRDRLMEVTEEFYNKNIHEFKTYFSSLENEY